MSDFNCQVQILVDHGIQCKDFEVWHLERISQHWNTFRTRTWKIIIFLRIVQSRNLRKFQAFENSKDSTFDLQKNVASKIALSFSNFQPKLTPPQLVAKQGLSPAGSCARRWWLTWAAYFRHLQLVAKGESVFRQPTGFYLFHPRFQIEFCEYLKSRARYSREGTSKIWKTNQPPNPPLFPWIKQIALVSVRGTWGRWGA